MIVVSCPNQNPSQLSAVQQIPPFGPFEAKNGLLLSKFFTLKKTGCGGKQ